MKMKICGTIVVLSLSLSLGCDSAGPDEDVGASRASVSMSASGPPPAVRAPWVSPPTPPPAWTAGLTVEEIRDAQRRELIERQVTATLARSSVVVVARVESETPVLSHYPGDAELEEMRLLVLTPETFLRGSGASLLVTESHTRRHFEPGARALWFLSDFEGGYFSEGNLGITADDRLPEFDLSMADLRGRI